MIVETGHRVSTADGMITVDQQVIIVNRRTVLAPPKTSASVRDLPMAAFVQEAIEEHTERFRLGEQDVLCRTPRATLLRRPRPYGARRRVCTKPGSRRHHPGRRMCTRCAPASDRGRISAGQRHRRG